MSNSRGISMIEVLVVIGLIATAAAITIPVTRSFVTREASDSASESAMNVIQSARNRAIAERRNVRLAFVAPNRITVERIEVPGPAVTLVDDVLLENGQTFFKFDSLPDTPDEFGVDDPVTFTGTLPVMFTSDGTLIDDNADVVNGTVLLGRDNDIATARAITIFGATGYVRAWKWGGLEWVR
jgi:type II secretory pathway pseudopilin PulG